MCGINDQIEEAKVQEAISIVQLNEFIKKLPEGINSNLQNADKIYPKGKTVNQFCSALAFESEIIIMDEATASIDPQTGQNQHSMQNLLAGKQLVVAHRLTSVLDADEILYFNEGRITARGKHSELLNNSPEYRKLVELQMLQVQDE